jgi:hypothetical protein
LNKECFIAPAGKYPKFVIAAQAAIQEITGCRIKSGMTVRPI